MTYLLMLVWVQAPCPMHATSFKHQLGCGWFYRRKKKIQIRRTTYNPLCIGTEGECSGFWLKTYFLMTFHSQNSLLLFFVACDTVFEKKN